MIDGTRYHAGVGQGLTDQTMVVMSCPQPNAGLPILHIGPHARFQVPSYSVTEHWLREGCGVRAWNEESVVVLDDVPNSGPDPGLPQCWNWYSEDWDSCSNEETYWYHLHQAPKVFVTRGQVTVHREVPDGTSCYLRWLAGETGYPSAQPGDGVFELGGDELDDPGERLTRMISRGLEGDEDYLQLQIDDDDQDPGCWGGLDWGAFEVRLEMHEENFHKDPS